MWHSLGISRSEELLEKAIAQVSFFKEKLTNTDIGQYLLNLVSHKKITFQSSKAEQQLRIVAETLNLIDVSYLIFKSAAWRKES